MVSQAPTQPVSKELERQGRPPLESGDRLSRAEFHRRYTMYPEIKKAELIEGVVLVGSPVHAQHSESHADIVTLLGFYRAHTPGLRLADNQSVISMMKMRFSLIFVCELMRPTAEELKELRRVCMLARQNLL